MLDAAIDLIEQSGPVVGVKQIAEQVGLPRSAVYRHFRDRHDLDEQVRVRVIERLMADLAPTLRPDGAVEETVDRAVRTYLDWIERHPRLHHFLGAGSKSERDTGSRVVSSAKTAIAVQISEYLVEALVRIGTDPALAEPLAFGMVGMVDATVNRWLTDPERTLSSAALADFLRTSVLHLINGHLVGSPVGAPTGLPPGAIRPEPAPDRAATAAPPRTPG